MNSPQPAVFLDRDGTLNVEAGYLNDPDQIEMIPGAVEAVRCLCDAGFRTVLITNQSGVGRGLISEDELERVNNRVLGEVEKAGGRIDAVYFCPHHPTEARGAYLKDCDCRKPGPGMLMRAAADLEIDLSGSFMVGDHVSDLEAGWAAGCRSILLRTGHGLHELAKVERDGLRKPDFLADNIVEAVDWILRA